MNGTNVDYYVSGFDTAGKRVGSLICDFDPNKDKNAEKLAALKEKARGLFTDAAAVEVITAEDFNKYVSGDYIRGYDGAPVEYVPPEPSGDEKKAQEAAAIAAEYDARAADLKDALATATLAGDADLIAEIKAEYAEIMAEYKEKLEALK